MLFRISFSDNSIWIFVVSAMKSSRTRAQRYFTILLRFMY